MAANHAPVLDYWDKIGTPTNTHRWCCSIMKTAPLYKTFKISGTNKQGKVLTFDGVRAEESLRRSNYQRTGKGKHTNIVNAHPVLNWNTSEIFLYLFRYNLPINPAYRFGKARVGCLICPFSSAWDDMISKKYFPEELSPFVDRLSTWANKRGVKDSESYLRDKKWKIKSLGSMDSIKTDVRFTQIDDNLIADIISPNFSIYSWLTAIGKFNVNSKKNSDKGELSYNGGIYSFEIKKHSNEHLTFNLSDCKDSKLISLIKRVIYKSSYCIQCEVCEVDCPTGALLIYPELKIDNSKCIHCHKCLDAYDRGCIATDCIRMLKDSDKNVTAKVQAYKTFGFHEDWLSEFFSDPDGFWVINSLGTAQVDGFKMWLKHAEIIDAKLALTPFGKALKEVYIDDVNFSWEAILTNLTYNSYIFKWFANNVAIGQVYDKSSLVEAIMEEGVDGTKKTVEGAVAALIQTFNYSPIGDILNYAESKDNKLMMRGAYEDISEKGLAYSLYKFAEMHGVRSLRMADFYEPDCINGLGKVFGITKSIFDKALRALNSSSVRILNADLNMGLDNISLRDDISSVSIVESHL
jgi:phosphoadenosine phosphosulfate reductase